MVLELGLGTVRARVGTGDQMICGRKGLGLWLKLGLVENWGWSGRGLGLEVRVRERWGLDKEKGMWRVGVREGWG